MYSLRRGVGLLPRALAADRPPSSLLHVCACLCCLAMLSRNRDVAHPSAFPCFAASPCFALGGTMSKITKKCVVVPVSLCLIASCGLLVLPAARADESNFRLSTPVPIAPDRGFVESGTFGPGHRGLDYSVPAGTTVRVAGAGRVSFVGNVAGNLSVSVEHGGGWQTSYSFLSAPIVAIDESVKDGQPVALSGPGHQGGRPALHFALRKGERYVDPALFMAERAHLVTPPEAGIDHSSGMTGRGSTPGRAAGRPGRLPRSDPRILPPKCILVTVACLALVESFIDRARAVADSIASDAVGVVAGVMNDLANGVDWLARNVETAARHIHEQVVGARRLAAAGARRSVQLAFEATATAAGIFLPFFPGLSEQIRRRGASLAERAEESAARWADSAVDSSTGLFDRSVKAVGSRARRIERAGAFQRSQRDCSDVRGPPQRLRDAVVVLVGGFGSELAAGGVPFGLSLARSGLMPTLVVSFSYRGFTERPGNLPIGEPYEASSTWNGIPEAARRLFDLIEAVSRARPEAPVFIVAHSQGGVVARYMLLEIAPRAPRRNAKIARLITIGSPHNGSRGAARIQEARRSGSGQALDEAARRRQLGIPSKSLEDLAEGSEVMRRIRDRTPDGIPVTSIAAAEDMIVPAPQSFLRDAQNVLVETGLPGAGAHSGQLANDETTRALNLALSGQVPCVSSSQWARSETRSVLVDEGVDAAGGLVADAVGLTAPS